MFNNLFKKKKTQEDIETEITAAINEIIEKQVRGHRDFSKLLDLDSELIENQSFNPIMAIAFEEMVKQTENAFLCEVDIQTVLDYLNDLKTFPNKAHHGYAEIWLTHQNLFEQKPQRYMSVLSTERDIGEQFKELKENVEIYEKDFMIILDVLKTSIEKFKNRDNYDKSDLDGAYERFSILTGFMLSDISEKQILSARKALLSYALNSDLEEAHNCYDICKRQLYEKYISIIKHDGTVVPAVDILIGNAILQANDGENISPDTIEEYTKEINTFTDEFGNVPEMSEQINLCLNVFKYLGLYGGK